jgi:chromosome segregation ATPase
MRRSIVLPMLLLLLASLSACQEQVTQPEVDMQALRQAVLKKTEQIYFIHLKLDSASTDITEAELKARNADCSDAEYLAADAYRNLEQADEALLELGRDLQEMFNLDIEIASGD